MAKNWSPDCCIAATRVAVDTLHLLGFAAKPQPTKMMAFTKNLWRRVANNTFERPFLPGEYSVGAGFGLPERTDGGGGYDGHLVALAKEGDSKNALIVDLALGQVSRPTRGIVVPPAIFSATNKIVLNGCVIIYEHHENPKFKVAPDWTRTDRTDPIVEELLRIIK